jgi:hypothetical protein
MRGSAASNLLEWLEDQRPHIRQVFSHISDTHVRQVFNPISGRCSIRLITMEKENLKRNTLKTGT